MQEIIHGAGILEEFLQHVGVFRMQSLGTPSSKQTRAEYKEGALNLPKDTKAKIFDTSSCATTKDVPNSGKHFSVSLSTENSSEAHWALAALGSGPRCGAVGTAASEQSSLAALVRATQSTNQKFLQTLDEEEVDEYEGDNSEDHSASEEEVATAQSNGLDPHGEFFQWFVMHHRRCNSDVVLKLKCVYDNFKHTDIWIALPKQAKFTYVRLCELFEQHLTLGADYRARLQQHLGFVRDVLVGWEAGQAPVAGVRTDMQDMISALLRLSKPADPGDAPATDPPKTMLTLITVAEGKIEDKPRKKTRSENLEYQRWNEGRKVKKEQSSASRGSGSHAHVAVIPLSPASPSDSCSCSRLSASSPSSSTEISTPSVAPLPRDVLDILEESKLGLVVQKWRKDRKERGVYWVYDRDSKYKFDTIIGTAALCAASIEHVVFGPKRTLTGVELPLPTSVCKRSSSSSCEQFLPSSPVLRRSASLTELNPIPEAQIVPKQGDAVSRLKVVSRTSKVETLAEIPLPDIVRKLLSEVKLVPVALSWHEDRHSKGTFWLRKVEGRFKVNTKTDKVWYWPPHCRKHVVLSKSGEDPVTSCSAFSAMSSSSSSTSTVSLSQDTKNQPEPPNRIHLTTHEAALRASPRKKSQLEATDLPVVIGKKALRERQKGIVSLDPVALPKAEMEAANEQKEHMSAKSESSMMEEVLKDLEPSGRKSVGHRSLKTRGREKIKFSENVVVPSPGSPKKRPSSPDARKKRGYARTNSTRLNSVPIDAIASASLENRVSEVRPAESSLNSLERHPLPSDLYSIHPGLQRWSSRLHGGMVEYGTDLPRRTKSRKMLADVPARSKQPAVEDSPQRKKGDDSATLSVVDTEPHSSGFASPVALQCSESNAEVGGNLVHILGVDQGSVGAITPAAEIGLDVAPSFDVKGSENICATTFPLPDSSAHSITEATAEGIGFEAKSPPLAVAEVHALDVNTVKDSINCLSATCPDATPTNIVIDTAISPQQNHLIHAACIELLADAKSSDSEPTERIISAEFHNGTNAPDTTISNQAEASLVAFPSVSPLAVEDPANTPTSLSIESSRAQFMGPQLEAAEIEVANMNSRGSSELLQVELPDLEQARARGHPHDSRENLDRRRRRRTRSIILTTPSWMVTSKNHLGTASSEIEAIFDVIEQKTDSEAVTKTCSDQQPIEDTCSVDGSESALMRDRSETERSQIVAQSAYAGDDHALKYEPHGQQQCSNSRDMVPPSTYVCKLCYFPGHWMEGCPKYICDGCNRQGHAISFCPLRQAIGRLVDKRPRDNDSRTSKYDRVDSRTKILPPSFGDHWQRFKPADRKEEKYRREFGPETQSGWAGHQISGRRSASLSRAVESRSRSAGRDRTRSFKSARTTSRGRDDPFCNHSSHDTFRSSSRVSGVSSASSDSLSRFHPERKADPRPEPSGMMGRNDFDKGRNSVPRSKSRAREYAPNESRSAQASFSRSSSHSRSIPGAQRRNDRSNRLFDN